MLTSGWGSCSDGLNGRCATFVAVVSLESVQLGKHEFGRGGGGLQKWIIVVARRGFACRRILGRMEVTVKVRFKEGFSS